jgi:hypothetical protein
MVFRRGTVMPDEMTDDERRRFEEEVLHHEGRDESTSMTAPASEADVVRETERREPAKKRATVLPNPD